MATCLFPLILMVHPVPEGVIFRAIEIVIRSDQIEIRYQLGLNDAMIRSELQRLGVPPDELPRDSVEALAGYRDLVCREIPEGLTASLNYRPVVLQSVRADLVRQQHCQIEVVLRLDLPEDAGDVRFELSDENFQGVPGYHLTALRSRGAWEVVPQGPQVLPERIPNLPDAGLPGWIPPAPARRVDVLLRAPATRAGSDAAAADPMQALPRDADPRAATPAELGGGVSGAQAATGSGATPPGAAGRIPPGLWSAIFALLALLIVVAWIRNARTRPASSHGNGRA